MAGFGSLSLAQTVVGTLLDQRVVVLYEQDPLLGVKGEELFTGLLGGLGVLTNVANVAGLNRTSIKYLDCKVSQDSDICTHPLESGRTIAETSVIKPIEAVVTVAMPTYFYTRIFNSMSKFLVNKNQESTAKIALVTKFKTYKNLVLKSMEYTLDKNNADTTTIKLNLMEVLDASVVFDNGGFGLDSLYDVTDSDTINLGTIAGFEISI